MGSKEARVVVVGGNGQVSDHGARSQAIRTFQSSRYGGNGAIAAAVASIRAGAVRFVVLLVRWLGHADERALIRACEASGVPFRRVRGGLTAAKRAIRAYVGGR